MAADRWQSIEELYHEASGLPVGERESFLHAACGEDRNLLLEVRSLLEYGEMPQSVLESPAIAVLAKAMAIDEIQSSAALLEGKIISHYRLLEAIGQGGMGIVYKAEDLKLERLVALKLLPAILARDPQSLQRFEKEARAASALNHPNICTVYEIDEADGLRFISIEFLDGETLKSRLARGPLQTEEIVRIASDVCKALEAAHSNSIVHRDIKPANIFLTQYGAAKVLDFGVAKRLRSDLEKPRAHDATPLASRLDIRLTIPGGQIGTVAYMSPEQAAHDSVDGRSDIFSLGAMIYEMATGVLPFRADTTADVVRQIRNQTPKPIVEVNPKASSVLSRIIDKAMRKEPRFRYQTAAEMLADLMSLQFRLEKKGAWKRAVLAPALVVLLGLGIFGYLRLRQVPGIPEAPSSSAVREIKALAVLPLQNLTGDDSQEYLVDGITDALISNLAQIRSLRIISRESMMGYKNKKRSPEQIAKELNVDVLVAGSLSRFGDAVSIETQFIRGPNWQAVWTKTYRRNINELSELQSDIARTIRLEIQTEMAPHEQFRVAVERAVHPEAYELYLRGRYCWNKRTEEGYDKAIQFFERAIAIQPDYAQAYAGLADCFAMLSDWKKRGLSRLETISLARSNALKALQLDESLADAHASLGSISYVYDWNWPLAEKEFQRAIELNSNYATAHHWYAYYCFSRNRIDEGLREIRMAQQLDPQSLIIHNDVGQLLYEARQYDEAIEEERRTLEMEQSLPWPHLWLGLSYLAKGQNPEAIAELQSHVRLSGGTPGAMAVLGMAYARTGRVAEAQQVLEEIRALPVEKYEALADIAFLLEALGQKDEAYAWLERILPDRPRPLKSLHVLPYLDPLRSDPRFQELQRRVGLP